MSDLTLNAETRTQFGKGAARKIRRDHKIPAVMYGHGAKPIHITLPGHDAMMALKHANALLTITLGDEEHMALAKDVQRDPIKPVIEHVDLVIVRKGEKVTVDVPVHIEGEAAPETVVTTDSNTLQLEVEATNIPESLTVSVEGLEAGTQILAGAVELPAGATLVTDGRGLKVAGRDGGFFLGPSLFDRVSPAMSIYKDEIFGPVLGTTRVATYDDAIKLINSNPYANGVAIFTNDGGAARKFQHEVEVGMVGINVPIPVPMAYYSFGGWKASLFGDHHIYGRDGVRFYTRTKAITSRWPDPRHRGVNLGFPQNN